MAMTIRPLLPQDLASAQSVFARTIADTFRANGIDDVEGVASETRDKNERLALYLSGSLPDSLYVAAEEEGALLGIAALYSLAPILLSIAPGAAPGDLEIGSVYVLKEAQGRGLAPRLLEPLLCELKKRGRDDFFLDCGYATSQVYWRSIFGEPYFRSDSFFGPDEAYMIWRLRVDEAIAAVEVRIG